MSLCAIAGHCARVSHVGRRLTNIVTPGNFTSSSGQHDGGRGRKLLYCWLAQIVVGVAEAGLPRLEVFVGACVCSTCGFSSPLLLPVRLRLCLLLRLQWVLWASSLLPPAAYYCPHYYFLPSFVVSYVIDGLVYVVILLSLLIVRVTCAGAVFYWWWVAQTNAVVVVLTLIIISFIEWHGGAAFSAANSQQDCPVFKFTRGLFVWSLHDLRKCVCLREFACFLP